MLAVSILALHLLLSLQGPHYYFVHGHVLLLPLLLQQLQQQLLLLLQISFQ